ncbi:MAG: twin-arginine translocation signal domain-containing protein, partial [Bacteroidales bacterium]
METKNGLSRRSFLKSGAMASALGAIGTGTGAATILSSCSSQEEKKPAYTPLRPQSEIYIPYLTDKAIDGKPLKAGIIGCGGRGSGAAFNFLDAADNVTITALADVFQERVDGLRNTLKEKRNIDIPAENCFVGFDAYQKVI